MGDRRKIQLDCRLYETTNENRFKSGDALTAYVYPAGGFSTGLDSGSGSFVLDKISGRTSLEVDDYIYSVNTITGAEVSTNSCQITAIEESAGTEGLFNITVSSVGSFGVGSGGRIVQNRSQHNPVPVYKHPSGTVLVNGSLGSETSIDVPENGLIEGYVEVDAVDVYFTGDTIDDGWYLFDVPAGTGSIGPLTVRTETLEATATLNVDYDTGVVVLDTDTAAITAIEHARGGRVLVVYPSVDSLQLTTVDTQADNTIYEATGRTIDLEEGSPLVLLGVSGSAGVAYWVIVGAANLVDVGLDDLTDVDISSPGTSSVLHWNGSTWTDTLQIGKPDDPLSAIYATVVALVGGGGDRVILAYGGSTDRTVSIPDGASTTQMLTTGDTQSVTGAKTFDDDAMVLKDPAANKYGRFDLGSVTTGQTRILTIQDSSGTIAYLTDVPSNFSELDDTDITTPTTGDSLRYNGTDWENGTQTGVVGVGHTVYASSDGGLRLTEPSIGDYVEFALSGALNSDKTLNLDGGFTDNDFLVTAVANHKRITIYYGQSGTGNADGLGWLDQLVNGNSEAPNALLVMKADKVCNLTGLELNIYPAAGSGTSGDYELQLYYGASLPTASTIPPASSTAVLSSTIAIPAGGSVSVNSLTSGDFSNAQVPVDNYVYLALAAGTTKPTAVVNLEMSLQYWEQTK